jgi:hypothetical protein
MEALAQKIIELLLTAPSERGDWHWEDVMPVLTAVF